MRTLVLKLLTFKKVKLIFGHPVHVYSFLLTSTLAVSTCIIDTGQSAYTYKLNYAHHEAAASIVIVFLMAKCERIVHKSF